MSNLLEPQESFPKENWIEYSREQGKQIGLLKAALIKERFWVIWKGGECASVEKATAKAEHQLKSELPGVDW